jgi:peroxiredoxin
MNNSVRRLARAALVGAALLALLAASCGRKQRTPEGAPATRAESSPNVTITSYATAPDVELKAIDGTSTALSSFHGKIVILTFMATWNKDCQEQFTALNQLEAKLQRYQFAVLGVVTDTNGKAALERFLAGRTLDYPIYYNGAEIASRFGGVGKIPTTYILLRDGSIYVKETGYRSMRALDEIIKGIMAQRL